MKGLKIALERAANQARQKEWTDCEKKNWTKKILPRANEHSSIK
jgi:hypothetical protein